MANFFIAVGGVGQNVAIAYYRLTKLCGYEPAKIYVMDSDLSISRHQPSFTPLEPIPIEPCILPLQRNSLHDLFNPRREEDIDSILSVLFTSKELGTPIDEGMFGRPSVGSATIMNKIILLDNDNTRDGHCRRSDINFANLLEMLRSPGNHCVVICGSAKGGTGAGGVPTLAQYIAENVDKNRVKIIILYFLTHFNISPSKERLQYDEIKNIQLKVNAESGMCYIADEINKGVDACILFGLLEPDDVPYREAQKQEEIEMFLYLLSAIIGNNSFYANLKDIFPQHPGSIYAYWIPYDENSKTSNLMVSDINVYLPNGTFISLDNIPKLAEATIDFLDIFSKYINPLPKFSLFPPLVIAKKLRQAINILCNNTQVNKETIYKSIAEKIIEDKAEIESNCDWFKRLLRNENDLANRRPLATVLSPNNNETMITITGDKYIKTKEQPMGFIRGWVKRTTWHNPGNTSDFVKPLIIELRKSISRAFLNNIFGDMNFTD